MSSNQHFTEQETVIQSLLKQGYELLGNTRSLLNGLPAAVLAKQSHTMVINSLGYDEYVKGMSWKLI